jgi:hypothetical protein
MNQWATQWQADHPEQGRPLPVTGSWNTGVYLYKYSGQFKTGEDVPTPEGWSAEYAVEAIKNGHHVIPSWRGNRSFGGFARNIGKDTGAPGNGPDVLSYISENGLPIAFVAGNYAGFPRKYEDFYDQEAGEPYEVTTESTMRFVKNGEIKTHFSSPISSVEKWREMGKGWMNSNALQRYQNGYPDPPMVIFLDNNEAGEIKPGMIDTNADRFVEKFGKDTVASWGKAKKREIIEEGYDERLGAFFEGMREAADPGWSDSLRFVAYNAWMAHPKLFFRGSLADDITEEDIWTRYDGAMPEYYNNDWQIGRGKADYSPWSPQTEALNIASVQDPAFDARPEYYFSSIGWDGSALSSGNFQSPPYQYVTNAKHAKKTEPHTSRYSFHRYEGMIQFGLWVMRPRSFREFRGGGARDAYGQGAWESYLNAVDRVWATDELQEFWKHGEPVIDPDQSSYNFVGEAPEDLPEWVDDNDRKVLLRCDANPPRSKWKQGDYVPIRVFATALVLGEEPNRRWLVVAQAPLGGVSDATVTLPGYGDLTLDHVAISGSFYIVDEAEDSVSSLIPGTPAEIRVETDSRYVSPGESVSVDASVVVPPETEFDEFEWQLGGKSSKTTSELGSQSVTFSGEGIRTLRVVGTTENDCSVVGEQFVFVGDEPDGSTIVDLSLDRATTWSGPWQTLGDEFPGELQEFRITPNRGSALDGVLVGGEFVDDAAEGRVLELNGNENVRIPREGATVGFNNEATTIALRFKPESLSGRQMLVEQGNQNAGYNIYLEDGTLYAGLHNGKYGGLNGQGNTPDAGGHWLTTDDVSAGEWNTLRYVVTDLKGGGGDEFEVTENGQRLYLNGTEVGSGPARNVYGTEAIGIGKARNTIVHTGNRVGWIGKADGNPYGFAGRISKFQLLHRVAQP